jgi:HemY protein
MLRLILFIALVVVLGSGFAWFADRPGLVTLNWEGTDYQTSLMVVLAGLVALVATLMILWWIVSVILRSPSLMRRFYRNRRRDRGYLALSQGLIAASSGDAGKARKLSKDSRNLLGNEALVQLLDAQTLLLEGNRQVARERFNAMLEDDDTRLVGLRGLYLEAEREGEKEASLHYAEEAAKLSPSLPWAGSALLRYQSATGDYEAALRTLETNRAAGLVSKPEA